MRSPTWGMQMGVTAKAAAMARYYRQSCADGSAQKAEPSREEARIAAGAWRSGAIGDPELVAKLFKTAKAAATAESIEILVKALRWAPTASGLSGSASKMGFCSVVAWASLDRSGRLAPLKAAPQIPRDILAPRETGALTVGEIADADAWAREHPWRAGTWAQLVAHCEAFAQAVIGSRPAELGYERAGDAYVAIADGAGSPAAPLAELYEQIAQSATPALPLFESIVGATPPASRDHPKDEATMAARLGGMATEHALAKAQRAVASAMCDLRPGEVLAVSGPPGTGKTAQLHAVVGASFARSAIEGTPRLIVACSTNNLAVTNINESFVAASKATEGGPGLLGRRGMRTRWIPRAESIGFGLYLPSRAKAAETPHPTPEKMAAGPESSNRIEARAFFVSRFREAFPTAQAAPGVEGARDWLLGELRGIDERLGAVQAAAARWRAAGGEDPQAAAKADRLAVDREREAQDARQRVSAWTQRCAEESLVQATLAFLPAVARKRDSQALAWLGAQGGDAARLAGELSGGRDAGSAWRAMEERLRQEAAKACERAAQARATAIEAATAQEAWRAACEAVDLPKPPKSDEPPTGDSQAGAKPGAPAPVPPLAALPAIDEELDKTLRGEAFWLAVHVWEARWIAEMEATLWGNDPEAWEKKSPEKLLRAWRRRAMLSPCFVSTFHMLPTIFRGFAKGPSGPVGVPFWNAIDLLIVDEAGQVSPEVGACSFALAKRALVVGDTKQIEPVWSIQEGPDQGNATALAPPPAGVSAEQAFKAMVAAGRTASKGSLMRCAQVGSPFEPDGKLGRGMHLYEHRRCADEIIAYCNELCYEGTLIPKRGEDERRKGAGGFDRARLGLPAMGWAHVDGKSEAPPSGSRRNRTEASAIAGWIAANAQRLQAAYRKPGEGDPPLVDLVAVVSPYKAQAAAVKAELVARGIKDPIVCGTVHALQGAEKRVVIFSAANTKGDCAPGKTLFFDAGPNMLNVAVSRAKDSFLVFGDMSLYDADNALPSGVLAKHFRGENGGEIEIDAEWLRRPDLEEGAERVEIISELDGHRVALRDAFARAKSSLTIISPWITRDAVEADGILGLCEAAKARGVAVEIHTSADFNAERGTEAFDAIKAQLEAAGAVVREARNLHTKAIFIDDREMIVGSFNWLSSRRSGRLVYREKSVRHVSPAIAQERQRELEALAKIHAR